MCAEELRAHRRARFSPLFPLVLAMLFAAPFLFVPIPAAHAAGGLALDGSAAGSFSSAGTGTVTLSTTSANDVIVVLVANENTGHAILSTVSSTTASGLTFAKRSSGSINSQPFSDVEVWYAIATSQLSAVVITVTLSSGTDDASMVAFGVSGANTAVPWDANGALPAVGTSPSGATKPGVSGVSTSNPNDMILGFAGILDSAVDSPTETVGSGFSLIQDQYNPGGAGSSRAVAEYEIVSADQAGVSVALGTAVASSNAWIMIGDAIQPALTSVTSTSVACSPSTTIDVGLSTTCTATVTGESGSITGETITWSQTGGTGSVSFSLATCNLSGSPESCSVTVTGVTAGSATIQATYPGDTNNLGSSDTDALTVTNAPPTPTPSCPSTLGGVYMPAGSAFADNYGNTWAAPGGSANGGTYSSYFFQGPESTIPPPMLQGWGGTYGNYGGQQGWRISFYCA